MNGLQHWPAHGQRSGLVEHDHVQVHQPFQRLAAFEEHAQLSATSHGHGQRGGHGQSHGAGACDDQHGDGRGQGHLQRVVACKPDHEGERGQRQHHGHEDGTGAVGQPLHGRARALRLSDHAGNLRQQGGLAQRLRTAGHGAVVVQRTGQNAAAHFAVERRGFAGQHRLVHGGAALDNRRVHREALPRQDQHTVPRLNLFEGNNCFHAVADAAGGGRTQPGERVESGQGAAFGARFQRFAQQEKA
jgi:hypothetical protein